MSDITHEITGATTRIDKVCDPDAKRFALAGVHVMSRTIHQPAITEMHGKTTPAIEGTVFLTATDTRILAVTTAEGRAEQPALMPARLIAKRKAAGKRKVHCPITLNGEWRAADTVAPANEVQGRFPKPASVFPEVSPATHVTVTLDAALLAKLADGITTDGKITLHIEVPCGKRDGLTTESVVAVQGDSGFGAIMPISAEDNSDIPRGRLMTAFAKSVKEYTKAAEQCKSWQFGE